MLMRWSLPHRCLEKAGWSMSLLTRGQHTSGTEHHVRLQAVPPNAKELFCAMEFSPTLFCSLHLTVFPR
jgi:hypothetical protein